MEMTRFSGANDPGYQAVSGELWLWANEVEEQLASKPLQAQPAKSESFPNSDDLREKRGKKFATMADITGESGSSPVYSGNFNSGGGPIFAGKQSAGRDIVNR
jgi:hypothetical protein